MKWTQPQNMVSSGPFKLKTWTVNERIVAVRNPDYWDNSHTVLSQMTYLPIGSGAADVNRYRAGEIDITRSIPEIQFVSLKKELGSQVHVSPSLAVYYYAFNNQKPPFNDVRVRQALALGLDRDIIANKVLGQGRLRLTALRRTIPVALGLSLRPMPTGPRTSATRRRGNC